ncbi:MAG: elongation factor P maturation arginine rhamnosyltransferase EarP [Pigmentiphaga sp.]|nr:elongation factor P maturation arginine rhamnosyltransferase EarP [Pigmentiphaga sp.]
MTTHPSAGIARQGEAKRDQSTIGPKARPNGGGAAPAARPERLTTHPSAGIARQGEAKRDQPMTGPTIRPNGPPAVDLFCRVIDNYGDIGVCWRLARRLSLELGRPTRLWVDDLRAFARLEPAVVPGLSRQSVAGIDVRLWNDAETAWPEPAPCVIEAFACELPAAFRGRLGPGHTWINLEYLSAEDWVESCHGLPSPQPGGMVKRFLFPGFTARTGGLLRESGLLAQRDAWQADPDRQEAFLRALGVAGTLAAEICLGRRRLLSVFCYPHAPLQELLGFLSRRGEPWLVLLAAGADPGPAWPGDAAIVLQRIPFLGQPDYDRVLWSADLNLVRGEDSFVRAQLAGRPLLWHIYPQADGAHQTKLEAWLAKAGPPPDLAELHRRWNAAPADTAATGAWTLASGTASWQDWRHWAQAWSGGLHALPELAETILAWPPGE